LERLHLRDFGNDTLGFRRIGGLADRGPEGAHIELAALGDICKVVVPRAHAAPAGIGAGGDTHRIEVSGELFGVVDPFLALGQRFACAAMKATPPAPRTTPVGLPLASFSIVPPGSWASSRRSWRASSPRC
jgi:hypothetical protein